MKTSTLLPADTGHVPELGDGHNLELMQAQLFRYARDMQELMDQHKQLQKHYQFMLQSTGREVPSNDLLPHLLMDAIGMYLVTDSDGYIMVASAEAERVFFYKASEFKGELIAILARPESSEALQSVTAKYREGSSHGGIEQRRLALGTKTAQYYDVLAMPIKKNGRSKICWFLQEATPVDDNPVAVQKSFLDAARGDTGLIITDPFGTIRSVNAAFTQISGYSEADVLGTNPGMAESPQNGTGFFQDLWSDLKGSGRGNGESFNRRKNGQIFLEWQSVKRVEDANGGVVSYVAAIADLSHRDDQSEQLTQLAYHDALTGLPNRRMLEGRLSQAITDASRNGSGLCVMYLDLDRFKPVNDELGHDVGDLVLQEVGARLKGAVRSGDTVARVGGDEFVVVLQSKSPMQDAESIACGILNALQAPIRAGYNTVSIGASIGCAIYPQDGEDSAALLKHADAAMYGAKRFGTQFSFYETGLDAHPVPNLGFEIWQALERNEMHLVYQPQVHSAAQGRVRGCEVLLRWTHATMGEIPPSIFIPIAEKSGAIVKLGIWVVHTACEQLRQWQNQGVHDFTLSVNVSLRQLRDPSFITDINNALVKNGIAPENLELELSETESLMFQDVDRQHIQALRNIGVKIAIDDFGIAFSNLAKLHSLAVTSIKINSQFVKDLAQSSDARAISNCMVAIGAAMGIEVIAEGVESAEQLAVLSAQGCQVIQGYWSGRPMLAAEMLQRTLAESVP